MSTMAQIKAMKAEYQKKIETEGKAALKEEFTAFFRDNPKNTAVRWRQYTPYFNDGDPCTFGVGEFTYKIDGKLDDGGDYEDGFYSTWGSEIKGHKRVAEAFEKAVRDTDVFESIFGDYVRVTATPEGFEVEEYSHD
jgi:hypothetical protein